MTLRIATRASRLALWQAHHVREMVRKRHPDEVVEIVPIRTSGDRILDRPLHEVDGKSLFIKELEEALADGRADLAVHCIKDYHPSVPDGFSLDVVMKRETAADLVLTREAHRGWKDLREGAVIGTTSQRRIFELRRLRPDFIFRQLRGNIDTRLRRLTEGEFDAIVLAEAGFHRLGLEHHTVFRLNPADMVPAVGQGALGIETLAGDAKTLEKIMFLNDNPTRELVEAERAFVRTVGGRCSSAIGSFACLDGEIITLTAFVGELGSMREIRKTLTSASDAAASLGVSLGDKFLAEGAAEILTSGCP